MESGWHAANGFRWRSLPKPSPAAPGFEEIATREGHGFAFTNRVSAAAALNNQILENGAGVALGDVNGDRWCDVYLCGSEPANALYLNLGDWRFQDVTASAGVGCSGQYSTGAVLADVDGDMDLDLLVNGLGVGTRLFRNDGNGHFTEDTHAGLERRSAATSLALGDVDGDGDLDLYVATYRVISARSEVPPPQIEVRQVQGKPVVSPADRFMVFPRTGGQMEIAEKGEPDHFYLNDGTGRFHEVTWTSGHFLDEDGRALQAPPEDWSLSVLLRDLNDDRAPDLYVCNDFFRSRDQFWLNDGRGKFRAAPPRIWRNMSLSSMAADAGDLDRDGHDDLIVVEMLARDHSLRQRQRANAFVREQGIPFANPMYRPELPRNTLFHARGDGTFAEIAQFAGLMASDWSWNVAMIDVDLDGFTDVLTAAGNQHDVLDMDAQTELDRRARRGPVRPLEFYPPLLQRSPAFRNKGDLTFEEVGQNWGLTNVGVAQGMAFGDLDNDGDVDWVVNRLNQSALLLRNRTAASRIAIRLRGAPPNTQGIGARIRVHDSSGAVQSQVIIAGGRYLSGDDPLKVFAVSEGGGPFKIEVQWPSGRRSQATERMPGRLLEFDEPGAGAEQPGAATPPVRAVQTLFEDVSDRVAHRHVEPDYDDFQLQPLLPHSLAHLGPGLAWGDLDADGWDDLLIAAGRGGRPGILRNLEGAAFREFVPASQRAESAESQTAIIPHLQSDGSPGFLVGVSSYSGAYSNRRPAVLA